MIKLVDKSKDNIWGLALAWYEEYFDSSIENPFEAKIRFLQKHGMKAFSAGVEEIDSLSSANQSTLFSMLKEYDMHCILHSSIRHMEDNQLKRITETEKQVKMLEKYLLPCRSAIVTTCAENSHRYDRKMPWSEKRSRFSEVMAPISKLCWEAGSIFCIENHADYFVSELLEVLKVTPRLYMFLDTANALHIGEQPIKACLDAAPYVVGTHFKDHKMIQGLNAPLHYEIQGCALGDGDAELAKQYEIIMEKSPFRDRLVMLFELFTPDDGSLSHKQCFEKSVQFVQTLIG